MKGSPKNAPDENAKAKPVFTSPLKLSRMKRANLKSGKGSVPHIIFNDNLGRWILKTDKPK